MSLLNEALRKKNSEHNQQEQRIPFQRESGSLNKRRNIIYIVLLVVVVAVSALGAIKIFSPLPSSSVTLPKTDKVQIQKTDTSREIKRTGPMSVTKNNKVTNDEVEQMKVPVQAPEEIEQRVAQKELLIDEQKKKPIKVVSNMGKPFSQGEKKIIHDRKKKNKISLKRATKKHIDKKSIDLFFQKALTYHRQNEFGEAIRMYRKILIQDPLHFDTRFNLASVYIKMETFSEAKRLLEQLNGDEPGNPKILLHLAITEIGRGRPQSALSYLALADNSKHGIRFEVYFHRGVSYSQLHDTDEAIIWYKRAEKLQPDNSRLLFNIAILYDKIQSYPDAIKYYARYKEQNISPDEKRKVEKRIVVIKAYQNKQSGQ